MWWPHSKRLIDRWRWRFRNVVACLRRVLRPQARWTSVHTQTQTHSYAESWCHAGKQPSAVGTVNERKQRSLSHSLRPTAVLANKARSPPLPSQSSRCLPLWPSFCIWLCVLLRAMCSLPGARLCACVSALSLRIMFFNADGLPAVACVYRSAVCTAVSSGLNNRPNEDQPTYWLRMRPSHVYVTVRSNRILWASAYQPSSVR